MEYPAEEPQLISITIEGLRRQSDDSTVSDLAQCEITLNADAPISEIWTKIEGISSIIYAVVFDIWLY